MEFIQNLKFEQSNYENPQPLYWPSRLVVDAPAGLDGRAGFSGGFLSLCPRRISCLVRIDLVVNRFTPSPGRAARVVAELFVLGFQVVLFYYGWILTQKMGNETAVSLPWIKMAWVYSVLPIAGGLMLLISLERLGHLLFGKGNGKGAEAAWSGSSSE
jgi:hypothetical protein